MSLIGTQATAVVTGAFLSGVMMSLSVIAVPVLLDTNTQASQLFQQWARIYHYGHLALPTLAIVVFFLYTYVSFNKRSAKQPWAGLALAGVTTLGVMPFTFIFMIPRNNELFRLESASKIDPSVKGIIEARELVVKWSWLHFTRSLLPLTGAIIGLKLTLADQISVRGTSKKEA
ncbi:MAG: hypothetical protein LQ342_006604 [Letrouitia transgressa]|nr:MAG: hypothetical protein LQ342_006604 [Letrouitia transgressa]